ncbi:SMC-Scp complex subunit ScpB [Aureispira anguillae]|uniref:SMC-Scp complex subunit ScpB n=1 Tax=Aureispira anguillae TaxID=2864201 RepID=A0A916DVM0_9BACT|nr:SMC-Scp complex subunit ScpB [Aureispira anguillae]BDS13256.1 SMC-Scp complex subunit ScpB [Aureispira anguillae]
MDNITSHIEALIFASDTPIPLKEIKLCLESILDEILDKTVLQNKIIALQQKYLNNNFSFSIVEIAGGYQFLTKPEFNETLSILIQQKSKKKLTKSALETLSVIAYRQPITKGEMERIRGVNCDYAVRKLLEKELVAITGRSKEVGRPLLYGTSEKFMQHFGLKSIKELPKLKEFKHEDNQIGTLTEE